MKSLVIIGAGGHGAVVADAARCAGMWSYIAFYDDRWPVLLESVGCEVLGNVEALRHRVTNSWPSQLQLVVALGDNSTRLSLAREFQAHGAELATIVHPAAVLSASSTIGPGTVVFAGAVINARSALGLACIINTGAIVDHDASIAAGTHVCPGVALAGNVSTGEMVTIGIGACVVQGRHIGTRAVVGAGATVLHDVEADCTVVGSPARRI